MKQGSGRRLYTEEPIHRGAYTQVPDVFESAPPRAAGHSDHRKETETLEWAESGGGRAAVGLHLQEALWSQEEPLAGQRVQGGQISLEW